MIPISTTEGKPLEFDAERLASQKVKAPAAKIGWVHTLSDTPGATFDLVIKDSLGRVKMAKRGCHSDTEKFGELINHPTLLGEELEVSVENVRGAKKIAVFLN